MNQKQGSSIIQATPSTMVPPGSAIPVQGTGRGAQGTVLPKKVVTLESLKDSVALNATANKSIEPSPSSVISQATKNLAADTGDQQPAVVERQPSPEKSEDALEDSTPDSRVPSKAEAAEGLPTPDSADTEPIELPDLTPEQLSFLTSERYRDASSMIKREFGMEDEDLSFLAEMEHAVLGGIINLEQFIIALKGEFPRLNEEEKSRLIGILLAYRFEPFADQLKPTPTEAARLQNIKLTPAPYYHIYTKPLTFRGAAHEIARMAGVDLMGQAQERLRDAIISRMKGIRTDGQIQELFMRPPELSGLGLPEDKARLAREALVELIGRARLLNEDEYAQWLNDQIHHKKAPIEAEAAALNATTLHADEEKEIAAIASRMPASPRAQEETVLSRAVAMVIRELSWRPSDEYLTRRLENTISTRLRDVRSRNEVFIKLIRDDKVGGLGLDRKQAEQIAEEIEKGYQSYRGAVAEEEKKKVKDQLVEQEQKVEERKRREAEEHAKWFEEKIKGKQDSAKSGLELLKVIARGQTTPIHPLDAKEEVRERASFGSLVQATKSGAMQDTANAMQQLADAFKEGKGAKKKSSAAQTPSASAAVPPPVVKQAPVVKVSVETARAAQQSVGSTKPKMQDVTHVKITGASNVGLSGPMQEIGQMTLEHFRRLAGDPKAAAKRVLDLADVLGHESYERRLAAADAWRSSPLQKMYLELVAAAFMGKKSVTDVAKAKLAAGQMAPTPEEILAIIDLNRALSL